ncbi:MAG: hypothetical protein NTY46_05600 [Candidatus Sumerlaeota bacterium]|nr:hypothetical protein [Candidatus Sumerlaeota bacterium]
MPASEMIKSQACQEVWDWLETQAGEKQGRSDVLTDGGGIAFIGHSRLVTNGAQQFNHNNQPVIRDGLVAIHNGIVTNVDDLWQRNPQLDRDYEIDTEIILAMFRQGLCAGLGIPATTRRVFSAIEGGASIAVLSSGSTSILLATNTGSLYTLTAPTKRTLIFASEAFFLRTIMKREYTKLQLHDWRLDHLTAGHALLMNVHSGELSVFSLTNSGPSVDVGASWGERKPVPIREMTGAGKVITGLPSQRIPGQGPYILKISFVDEYPGNREAVAKLRRCTKCILPETMPFIEFDDQGICNYCRSYRPMKILGRDALLEAVAPYRKNTGEPECLVTFSGGRDSSYGLHYVKRELRLEPVTYTYDWGMVTDLARRNQMRMCGKLGVEHILVSADIAKKRANIRKNVSAWLRKPTLGTVPLFMAGDKQYFYYANKVGRQIGCKLIILCENPLETTRFKSGFCGIAPRHDSKHTYSLTFSDKARLALYYGWQYMKNPAYLNTSLADSLWAFLCYYAIPHPYLNIYEYIRWEEQPIADTLIGEYNWETASDTRSTWRIGDGTASFYNYIYYTMAGLTENDTFRSNQIREGMLERAEALRLSERDNEPRYESIQWYCDIIGVDFYETINAINKAGKLYAK